MKHYNTAPMSQRSNFLPQGMRRQLCKRWHFQTKKWSWRFNRWNLSHSPRVPANLLDLHRCSFLHHPKMPVLVKIITTTFIGLICGAFILNWSILSSKEKPLRRWLTFAADSFAQLSWVNQERFAPDISGTIWETGSRVHPSQHEWLEANPDHLAPQSQNPIEGGLWNVLMRQNFPPTYPPTTSIVAIKPRMCFCSDHSLVSDSGAILWSPGVIMVVTI